MNLPNELRAFIESLNAAHVKYVIVGGYAVAFHGYPRFTGDIDFFVDRPLENAVSKKTDYPYTPLIEAWNGALLAL